MNLLRKGWFKILVSLMGGGMVSELLHIITTNANKPMKSNPSLIAAVIIYFAITFGIYLYDYLKVRAEDK